MRVCATNFRPLFLIIWFNYQCLNQHYIILSQKGAEDGPLVGFVSYVHAGVLQVVTQVHPTEEQLVPLD